MGEHETVFQLGKFRIEKVAERGYIIQGQEPVRIWNGEIRENWSKYANRIDGLRMPVNIYRLGAEKYGGVVTPKGTACFNCPVAAQEFIEDFLVPHFTAVTMAGAFRWVELGLGLDVV